MSLAISPYILPPDRKPPYGAKLNYISPLCDNLKIAFLFNEGGGNKVFPAVWQASTQYVGDLINTPTWTGSNLKFDNNNSQYIRLGYWPGYQRFTVVSRFSVPNNSGNSTYLGAENSGSGLCTWRFKNYSTGDGYNFQLYYYSGTTQYVANSWPGFVLPDKYYTYMIRTKSDGIELYIDSYCSISLSDGPIDTTSSYISIAAEIWRISDFAMDKYAPMTMDYFYVFDKELTTSEMINVRLNPYQFFAPSISGWIFGPSAAASRCFTNTPLNSGIFNSAIR